MNRFVYIMPVIAVGCAYRLYVDYRRRRQVVSRLKARPQLTEEEFGVTYFSPQQAPIASEVRGMLKRHVPFRLSGLHPSDAFVEDLQITTFYRTAMIEFLMNVETRFGVALRHKEGITIRTVGDLVDAIDRQRSKNG